MSSKYNIYSLEQEDCEEFVKMRIKDAYDMYPEFQVNSYTEFYFNILDGCYLPIRLMAFDKETGQVLGLLLAQSETVAHLEGEGVAIAHILGLEEGVGSSLFKDLVKRLKDTDYRWLSYFTPSDDEKCPIKYHFKYINKEAHNG